MIGLLETIINISALVLLITFTIVIVATTWGVFFAVVVPYIIDLYKGLK